MSTGKEQIVSTKQIRKRTLLSFTFFFVLIVAAIFGWKWLRRQPDDNDVPKPFRVVLNANEKLFTNYLFSSSNLSKKYSLSDVVPHTRVNGDIGMSDNFDPATWKLQVVRKTGDTLFITMDEIKALPKTEII